ncbi:hypothetical protein IFR05_003126 [Cadophora sp. M221]|nr:hypothetical protein IFR05_003126 [Cadophora sp. M221]
MSSHSTIPTPSPLPSPPINPDSLSERINKSTRPLHTQLNRLILTRLPLALPPYTTNPSTYVSGLLHILPIYSTFEDLWGTLLSSDQLPTNLQTSHDDACDPKSPIPDPKDATTPLHTPKICTRTQSLLTHLRLPGLLRAERLLNDIHTLTLTPTHLVTLQIEAISHSGSLSEFLQHTRKSVQANPHVLLAYAWVLYMALFSGGRYLRAALKEAGGQGSSFWSRDSSPVRPYSLDDSFIPPRSTSRPSPPAASSKSASETNTAPTRPFPARLPPPEPNAKALPGLQFFHFPGEEDGEDLKVLFKARIAEAEVLLTEGEKGDIVLEAQYIFTYMLKLVDQLDAVMGTMDGELEGMSSAGGGVGVGLGGSSRGRPLNASRDSVSIAKERMSRRGTCTGNGTGIGENRDDQDGDNVAEEGHGDRGRKNSFLNVVAGPMAKIVLFKGRIPSFDQVVRRFSKGGSPQVTFVTEPEIEMDMDGKEKQGEKEGDANENGIVCVAARRMSEKQRGGSESIGLGGLVMPILAILLLLAFFMLYKLK